jgi:5-methylcytosine-specific restriction endonuclease McrA
MDHILPELGIRLRVNEVDGPLMEARAARTKADKEAVQSMKDSAARARVIAEARELRKLRKLRSQATAVVKDGYKREPISASVRSEVWRRDNGCCVDCGSRDRLELDHIIPVSKGGSSSARNIELRCLPCNRSKGAKI